MLLVTTWFGTFLLDGGKVVKERLFPRDAGALADRLGKVEDWKILDEERELMSSADEVFVTEPRLERSGGRMFAERPPFLDPATWGYDQPLLHAAMVELGKRRMRKAIRAEDHLRHAVATLDDLKDQENLLLERLREWYGLHFPELARIVDAAKYLELVATHGRRDSMPLDSRESVGAELGAAEEAEVKEIARLVQGVGQRRATLEGYVERAVRALAPNVSDLAGPLLAARLVTLAGGLEELARAPAGTIQLLGAEKALFRHLKTGARSPKHGVLFLHPLVNRAPPWQRGAIARAFAAKLAIASRADAYTKRRASPELLEQLDHAIAEIRRRKATRPPKGRPALGKGRRRRRP